MSKGLRITRRFTEAGKDAYDRIEWSRRDSRITNPDGSIVFEMTDAEIPATWSQVASDIMVSKYFRKAGVPQLDESLKVAVVEGAVTGGGLTVIANAPNPAGQALLARFFGGAIVPLGLFLGALLPTLVAILAFRLI